MACWLYDNCNHKSCGECRCDRRERLGELYDLALLSHEQRKKVTLSPDADRSDQEVFDELKLMTEDIKNFVDSGRNLFIYSGQCGNGKTSWAVRFIQCYLDKMWSRSDGSCRALFVSVPRYFLALKDNISEKSDYVAKIRENVLSADLVVWDDISHHVSSDFEITHLLNIIDTRNNAGKSNIYTANVPPEELSKYLGERLASRVANKSYCVQFVGGDKRSLGVGGNK